MISGDLVVYPIPRCLLLLGYHRIKKYFCFGHRMPNVCTATRMAYSCFHVMFMLHCFGWIVYFRILKISYKHAICSYYYYYYSSLTNLQQKPLRLICSILLTLEENIALQVVGWLNNQKSKASYKYSHFYHSLNLRSHRKSCSLFNFKQLKLAYILHNTIKSVQVFLRN